MKGEGRGAWWKSMMDKVHREWSLAKRAWAPPEDAVWISAKLDSIAERQEAIIARIRSAELEARARIAARSK